MLRDSGVYGLARTPGSAPITESTGISYGSTASDPDPSSTRSCARSIAGDDSVRDSPEDGAQQVQNDFGRLAGDVGPGRDIVQWVYPPTVTHSAVGTKTELVQPCRRRPAPPVGPEPTRG